MITTWEARANITFDPQLLKEVELAFVPVWTGVGVKLGKDVYEIVKREIMKRRREKRNKCSLVYT